MEETASQLKNREKSTQDMKRLDDDLEAAIRKIKNNPRIAPTEIDGLYTSLVNQMNKQMVALQDMVKQQKVAEEQARLRKIQQELELEKKRKEEGGGREQGKNSIWKPEERLKRSRGENRRRRIKRPQLLFRFVEFLCNNINL